MTDTPVKTRILFVDDDPNILQAMRRSFHGMRDRWVLTFAASGREALERMAAGPVDVVVTDMKMPGMDGARLLEEVRAKYPGVVRIILSGQSDQDTVLRTVKTAHQYLSKPCKPEALKTALDQVVAVCRSSDASTVKSLVAQMTIIPSLPTLYVDIMAEMESPYGSIQRIGEIVAKDIGMTAQILKIVNSSFFGFFKTITDPGHAVSLLGIETVQALVLSAHIFAEAPKELSALLSLERMWEHSLTVAAYAKIITNTETADRKMASDAFIGGMMHDVGKLVIAANFSETYRSVLSGGENGLAHRESAIFGATHADIGAHLMRLWGISEPVVEAIGRHHRNAGALAEGPFGPDGAVFAANLIDHQLHPTEGAAANANPSTSPDPSNLDPHWPVWHRACRDAIA